jgi:signal transduction histidine kinase
MTRLFIALLIFYSSFSNAQAAEDNPSEARYADSLLALAHSIYYSNPDSSLYYSNMALDHAVKYGLELQMARAWLCQARTEVLKGDINPALLHLKRAADIFEKNNNQIYLAKCYGLMSTAVSKIDNTAESINLLLKASNIYRQLKDETGLTSTLVNLANEYSGIGKFDKALEALNESKQYTRPGDEQWYFYYINAGLIHMGRKNYTLAKIQFDSCLAISRRHKMVDAEVTAVTKLADLALETKKFNEAVSYFNTAIRMSRSNLLPLEESDALTGLMHCYEAMGDYRNAFTCQNRLKVISDSLFNIEKIKNINTVEAKLKVSEKEKTIALQKLDMEKNAAEQEKSKKRITLLVAGASLLAIILFFTFYVYIKAKRQKREVELQKTRAERLNSLNQKIFAVIAHDFKSPMITLNMLMDLLDKENISKEDLSSYSADVRNQIIQSVQILDNLLNWARTELNLSRSGNLKSSPYLISQEIIKELGYMSSRKNVHISNEIPKSLLLNVPPDILRIITRNLLSNAVKFSFSNSLVTIGHNHDHALFVQDSGAGINEKTMNALFNGTVQSRLGTFNETGFGLGLHITHELIHKFNGRIRVEKNHPSGTIFTFVLPAYEQN